MKEKEYHQVADMIRIRCALEILKECKNKNSILINAAIESLYALNEDLTDRIYKQNKGKFNT